MTAPLPTNVYADPSWWDLSNERVQASLTEALLASAVGIISILRDSDRPHERPRAILRDLLQTVPDLLELVAEQRVLGLSADEVLVLAGLRRPAASPGLHLVGGGSR